MIKINWLGRDRVFMNTTDMAERLKIVPLDQEQFVYITKRSLRGETTYGGINPLVSELHGVKKAVLAPTLADLTDRIARLAEEV